LLEMENSLDSELTAEQRTNTLQLGLKIDK
jgi:hypothetical protein